MSGRKQFEEARALDAAMQVFWAKGFEATSLCDLERATGLNKSSLYNAFNNKEDLFALCLERFSERFGKPLLWELERDDFYSAIGGFFERLVSRFEDPDVPTGCMATMAAMEFGRSEGSTKGLVCSNLESMQSAFKARCLRAVADRQLPGDTDCESLAALLVSQTRGLAVINRADGTSQLARQAVAGLLDTLALRAMPSAADDAP